MCISWREAWRESATAAADTPSAAASRRMPNAFFPGLMSLHRVAASFEARGNRAPVVGRLFFQPCALGLIVGAGLGIDALGFLLPRRVRSRAYHAAGDRTDDGAS